MHPYFGKAFYGLCILIAIYYVYNLHSSEKVGES